MVSEDIVPSDDEEDGIVEATSENNGNVGVSGGVSNAEEEDGDDFSFLGYVHPTPTECRHGLASRTELYRCRTCLSYTRFPRYNRAALVADAKRGRCGEYSMLLYRILRALGYDGVRWVVDWADHVWVEVRLGGRTGEYAGDRPAEEGSGDGDDDDDDGRWVHLDPCEAAVDNPLLYESWGKNQTYIVAFHDPFYVGDWRGGAAAAAGLVDSDDESPSRNGAASNILAAAVAEVGTTAPQEADKTTNITRRRRFCPVEDVTRQYTSDETHTIEERRGMDDKSVAEAIDVVADGLVDMLQRLMRGESRCGGPSF